jgi:predicted GIY-YIG superfamily endonuclease
MSRSIPRDSPQAMRAQGISTTNSNSLVQASPETNVLPSRTMRDGRFYKFWVYIVCSPSGTLYIGPAGYINVRIEQHKNEALEGFTKKYGCKRLVYYESYDSFYKAERRESN